MNFKKFKEAVEATYSEPNTYQIFEPSYTNCDGGYCIVGASLSALDLLARNNTYKNHMWKSDIFKVEFDATILDFKKITDMNDAGMTWQDILKELENERS